MREITFTMTFRDWQEAIRMGLANMAFAYRVFWTCLLLLIMVGLLLILVSKGYPATWPPTRLPPHSLLMSMGILVGIILAACVTNLIAIGVFARSRTVQILPRHLADKSKGTSNLIRWKNVTAIVNTGEHLCFCHNFPAATVVPESAFPNQEQARAFLEQAESDWRRETGRKEPPAPDVSGVWPPAPRQGNSQEPGDKPKC